MDDKKKGKLRVTRVEEVKHPMNIEQNNEMIKKVVEGWVTIFSALVEVVKGRN